MIPSPFLYDQYVEMSHLTVKIKKQWQLDKLWGKKKKKGTNIIWCL